MSTTTRNVRITASDENGIEGPSEFSLPTGKMTAWDDDLPADLAQRIADAFSTAEWDEFADVGGPDEPVFVSRSATIEFEMSDDDVRAVLAASARVGDRSEPKWCIEMRNAPETYQTSGCRGEMVCREFSSGDGDCCCGMRFPGEC